MMHGSITVKVDEREMDGVTPPCSPNSRRTSHIAWSGLTLTPVEVRAFQPARRDVPVSWNVAAEDGAPVGDLQVSAAQIRAGEGSGPVLPLDALFLVSGALTLEGREYPVRGLFRHTSP